MRFFAYFMSERIQIFDRKLKISFRFVIDVSIQSQNETLRFIQAALCAKEKSIQQRFIFHLCKGKKERIIRFFHDRKQKNELFSFTKKNKMLTSLDMLRIVRARRHDVSCYGDQIRHFVFNFIKNITICGHYMYSFFTVLLNFNIDVFFC
jgi:hypothetical protein